MDINPKDNLNNNGQFGENSNFLKHVVKERINGSSTNSMNHLKPEIFSQQSGCSLHGKVDVYLFDNYPKEIYWEIMASKKPDEKLMSRGCAVDTYNGNYNYGNDDYHNHNYYDNDYHNHNAITKREGTCYDHKGDHMESKRLIGCGTQYLFRITDDHGDGICCSHGDGHYRVDVDGIFILEGGEFSGHEEVKPFTVNGRTSTNYSTQKDKFTNRIELRTAVKIWVTTNCGPLRNIDIFLIWTSQK